MRTCICNRIPPTREKYVRGEHCGLCTAYHFDPHVRAAMDIPTNGEIQSTAGTKTRETRESKRDYRQPLACVHRGEPTGETRECVVCTGRVDVPLRTCAIHGVCYTGAYYLRGIQGCGNCNERVPSNPPGSILIPQPPPLDIRPTRPLALATVVVGDEARRLFEVSGPFMRAYADRVGADLVVLDWPGHPAWPMSAKFAIPRVLDHYERIAYVDADVLLRPAAIDLFASCHPDEFGVLDEMAWQERGGTHIQRYTKFRREHGFRDLPIPWYCNAGVMVASRQHQRYLMPPKFPVQPAHCTEQDHTNAVILDAHRRGEVKVRLLDRRCNWQNWTDSGFKTAPPDAILHWSGSGTENRRRRVDDLRSWASRYPLPVPAPPSDDRERMRIDARHRDWIASTLASGRFRRVLEIGCAYGYSTVAFLEALRAGHVDEVHLCEPHVRPDLEKLLGQYPGLPVTLHRCRSAELLARDCRFDLVFVDGSHTPAIVAEESRLLLAARVPVVFAHDTSIDLRQYPGQDGPRFLKLVFERAGYLGMEDAMLRPGERTDRGMFAAAATPELAAIVRSAWVDRPVATQQPAPQVATAPPGVRLSVIVATIGRPTLARTLESIRTQMRAGDEMIVEWDATGDMAATPRTRAMRAATGDYLLFMDDDDAYLPGALDTIRAAIAEQPGRVHLFAMEAQGWRLPQFGQEVRVENVSTQMIAVPNVKAKLGEWGRRRRGDYDFIAGTLAHYPDGPVWHDSAIVRVRPR